MTPETSQQLEAFVPIYDAVPETWEEGRQFLVEVLRRISQAVNVREISWFLDEELLAGKILFPGTGIPSSGEQPQNRQILRWVINSGALNAGANSINHDVLVDANFTLFDIWCAATDSAGLTSRIITGNDCVMNAATVSINSPAAFNRSFIIIEYTQEQ